MLEKFNLWIEAIIVAIAITTIIEMLLPEGNNKKYIKIVCSIYILFTIVNPILNLNKIKIEDFKIAKETINVSSYNAEVITEIYIKTYENEIKNKLIEEGYNLSNVKLNLDYSLANIESMQISTYYITEGEKEKLIKTISELYNINNVIIN